MDSNSLLRFRTFCITLLMTVGMRAAGSLDGKGRQVCAHMSARFLRDLLSEVAAIVGFSGRKERLSKRSTKGAAPNEFERTSGPIIMR
jgi:hypothetical protein